MIRINAEERLEAVLNAPVAPWRVITARDAARLLGVSTQTLANWRFRGIGPAAKSGAMNTRRQNYTSADIGVWLASLSGQTLMPSDISRMWLARRGTVGGDVAGVIDRLQRTKVVHLVEQILPLRSIVESPTATVLEAGP